jgi:hypothetical protein
MEGLPWVTAITFHQSADLSNEEAISGALDFAEALVRAGHNVTLGATLPDVPVGFCSSGDAEA